MKNFLNLNSDTLRILHRVVVVGLMLTASACSTGGSSNNTYFDKNTQNIRGDGTANVVSTGEAAVVNEVEARKITTPSFLANDPYTSLSPAEMIRIYGHGQ